MPNVCWSIMQLCVMTNDYYFLVLQINLAAINDAMYFVSRIFLYSLQLSLYVLLMLAPCSWCMIDGPWCILQLASSGIYLEFYCRMQSSFVVKQRNSALMPEKLLILS